MAMKRKSLLSFIVFLLFFGCLKFYLLSPFYVLSDLFYFMPRSAFDDYGGEGRKGMVWFPVTRVECALECG